MKDSYMMRKVQGGHNNWYQLNIDINLKPTPSSYSIDFLHDSVQELGFQQAADYTAKIICKEYDNLYLAMSGGMDSEYIADVLYRNHIPFTPVVVPLPNTDYHLYALQWCRSHNIEPWILDYNHNKVLAVTTSIASRVHNYVGVASLISYIASEVEAKNGHLISGSTGNWFTVGFKISSFIVDVYHAVKHPSTFFVHTPEILLAAVTELDFSVPEDQARSKLYNISLKTKDVSSFLSVSDMNKIHYVTKLGDYSTFDFQNYISAEDLLSRIKLQ